MRINKNLITLKCVMFTFFAGVGCLLAFLPLHMLALGLDRSEARIISIIAPFVAIIGPAIAGPLADKMSVGLGSSGDKSGGSGRILRIMIAACFLLGALFYSLLLAVPYTERNPVHRTSVNFTCSGSGAIVFQQICTEDRTCNRWNGVKSGALVLEQCEYACDSTPEVLATWNVSAMIDFTTTPPTVSEPEDDDEEDARELPAPHLCHYRPDQPDGVCHVFTATTHQLRVDIDLDTGTDNITDADQWCSFPSVSESFRCVIPPKRAAELAALASEPCVPVVKCNVTDPYDVPEGVLAQTPCQLVIGNPATTFWLYLVIRSIAEIFPTAALGLLGAACVVATRETSSGRGDVGRQFAVGSVAFVIFPPLVGLLMQASADAAPQTIFLAPLLTFAVFMLIGALILLLDKNMPLSPPEWWWHTANGTLAMPMNTVRRYGAEIAALFAVMVLLGILWSGLDTYLPWKLSDLDSDFVWVGLTLTVGAAPVVALLWWAEVVVDYIGHSNLLITAFIFYAVRFTGMGYLKDMGLPWVFALEALEVFTLGLVWVAAIFYFRHLVPRKYTSSGQALPVIAHFGIGRCVGAVIGGMAVTMEPLVPASDVYKGLAIASLVIAAVYLALYHLLLAPSCAAQPAPPDQALLQGLNSNGSSNGAYSPVRVYHEERSRKAHFRY